jgi:hypothetical protein
VDDKFASNLHGGLGDLRIKEIVLGETLEILDERKIQSENFFATVSGKINEFEESLIQHVRARAEQLRYWLSFLVLFICSACLFCLICTHIVAILVFYRYCLLYSDFARFDFALLDYRFTHICSILLSVPLFCVLVFTVKEGCDSIARS